MMTNYSLCPEASREQGCAQRADFSDVCALVRPVNSTLMVPFSPLSLAVNMNIRTQACTLGVKQLTDEA